MGNCYLSSITQGVTWSREITWTDGDGDPVPVTGYTARAQFRDASGELVAELVSNSSPAGIALGGAAGTVTLAFDASQTEQLPTGVLSVAVLMTSGSGVVSELLRSSVAVLAAVVHDD